MLPIKKCAFAALTLMPLLLALTRAGADIALGIIVLLFLLESGLTKRWSWVKEPEIKVLGAMWLFLLLVSPVTPINPKSAFIAALIWGRFILFYAAARFWLIESADSLKKITSIGLAIIAFAAIDTIWQYKTGISLTGRHMISDRLTGPLTKANIGNFLVKVGFPMLGMASYIMVMKGQARRLWMPAAGLAVLISLIMVSGERSTPILMLLSLGIVGLTLFISQPKIRIWVLATGATVALLLIVLAATQPIIMGKVQFFIEQISDFWNTCYGQLYIAAGKLWLQHPLTGIGAQQFLEACKPEVLNVTYCDVHPHNAYIEWLVATGLPGIVLFIWAMALILCRFLRGASFTGTSAILTAIGLSEFAVLLFPFVVTQSVFSNWSAMLFWYSLSLGMSVLKLEKLHD